MERQIVYAGSIPLDTDLLNIQRNVQVAIGTLARIILGTDAVVDGLSCIPDPGPFAVTITPGSLTVLTQNDFSSFGALPADGTLVVRTGLSLQNASVQLGTPADAGHVLCWLVQAMVTEFDGAPVALPYWNAANPAVPYSGPGNSGQAQNTQRVLRVALSAKPNSPQLWPIGTPPEPDAGWIGLYGVTTFFGKTAVEAGDIVSFHAAPRMRYTLPAMPPGSTQQDILTTSAIWVAPDSVQWARIRLVGGGGGGGGGDTGYSGGGGGGGGYSEALVRVQSRQSYPVVIGNGGGGGTPGVFGGTGGQTSFGDGLVVATGGQGGGSANPDSHGGQPGSGLAGVLRQGGGYGGDGAQQALIPGGNGGASAFGGGGRGSNQGGVPATGLASGSGGGGGYGVLSAGGPGGGGVVVVEY